MATKLEFSSFHKAELYSPASQQSWLLGYQGSMCFGSRDLAWLGDAVLPSANSFFIRNLWFNGDGKADAEEESKI